jgi:flagella basal body P-ring formation protein FlgA
MKALLALGCLVVHAVPAAAQAPPLAQAALEALRAAVPYPSRDVRISRLRLPSARIPKGTYSARVELRANEGFRGPTTFALVLTFGDDEVRLWATADIRVRLPVLVAARDLPRGHVLAASDLRQVRRELDERARMAVGEPTQALGRRLKRPLRAHEAVLPSDLERVRIVAPGAVVTLVATRHGLTVTARGRVLEGGSSGDTVRAENLASGRKVHARVKSARELEVEF